jgi:hypothetical protein
MRRLCWNRPGLALDVDTDGCVAITLQPFLDEGTEDALKAHRELVHDVAFSATPRARSRRSRERIRSTLALSSNITASVPCGPTAVIGSSVYIYYLFVI